MEVLKGQFNRRFSALPAGHIVNSLLVFLLFPGGPQKFPSEDEACKEDQAKQTYSSMGPYENWKHYQVC